MAYIQSAYLGDERAAQDVTKSINDKIEGGKIDVVANSSLIPMFEFGGEVKLSSSEESDVKQEAEKQCGSANDANCIAVTEAKLRQSKLEEKHREQQSSAFLVKGRRLTVNYVDDKGQRKTIVVPEGQEFKLEGLKQVKDTKSIIPEFEVESLLPSFSGTVLEGVKVTAIILGVFFYAFSIIATYKTFIQAGFTRIGYAATAAAVFIPYSGYVIMLLFFAVKEYMSIKARI
jgi:hypothetical protein